MIRVLVVDDDKLARKGLISLMNWEKYGMQVTGSVQNGKAALEFVRTNPVELVFVDIDMPEMNGIEFMEQCHRKNAGIQFVVLSFYEKFDYVQTTLRLGGLDYISKTSMDLEDCDGLLKRIREKYDEKLRSRAPQPETAAGESMARETEPDPDDAETLKKLSNDWNSMHWIFDDSFWEDMKKQMRIGRVSVRRMELIVSNCIGRLGERLGPEQKDLPLFDSMEELIGWAEQYRGQLMERTRTLPQESDIGRIANAVSYMRENYSEDLPVTEAASRIGASRSYFCTVFKQWVGVPYGSFLQQLRLTQARKMLDETELAVSEIAFRCGYHDIYYFSRVFHKAVGCSPADYRSLARTEPKKI